MHATFMRLLGDERAQGLVEYALVLALIAVACIFAIRRFGSTTSNLYTNISNATNAIGN